jgi:hypothetical protein
MSRRYLDTESGKEALRGTEYRGDRQMLCSNPDCGRAFQGKPWMTLCPGCYRAEAIKNPNRAEVIEWHAERGHADMKCERCGTETKIRRFCQDCLKVIFAPMRAEIEATRAT